MILGIGADILDINRFKKAVQKNPKIIERVFTPSEIVYARKLPFQKRESYYAKRFAGKEALSKACGTGIGKDLNWLDMEILNDKKGTPVASLSPKALKFLKKKFKTKSVKIFISLSDEKDFALAFSLITK